MRCKGQGRLYCVDVPQTLTNPIQPMHVPCTVSSSVKTTIEMRLELLPFSVNNMPVFSHSDLGISMLASEILLLLQAIGTGNENLRLESTTFVLLPRFSRYHARPEDLVQMYPLIRLKVECLGQDQTEIVILGIRLR